MRITFFFLNYVNENEIFTISNKAFYDTVMRIRIFFIMVMTMIFLNVTYLCYINENVFAALW